MDQLLMSIAAWLDHIDVSNRNLFEIINRHCQTSSIRRIKLHHFNVSRPVLQLSLAYPLKPGVKPTMKMYLEQRRQAMLQLHLRDEQLYYPQTSAL